MNNLRCLGIQQFYILAALWAGWLSPVFAQTPPPPAVDGLAAVGMTVSDLERSVAFFTDVLSFEKIAESRRAGEAFSRLTGIPEARARTARLRLGDEFIELTEFDAPKGRALPADSRSNDRWFQHMAIIVSDMDRAHARMHERMVRHASKDPQRLPDWNRNAAGIKAFYFRDPDGHFLEILEFPPDKGNPKWHRRPQAADAGRERPLFLGIDHTAIVVADTDTSLRFYRAALGLKVVGGSENYGVEQEDLNNVPGAHLRITTLRGAQGPAIEFLEYLHPRDGRPYPPDAKANDIVHWETTLLAADGRLLSERLRQDGVRFVSGQANDAGQYAEDFRFIVRDPDGHALRIQSR